MEAVAAAVQAAVASWSAVEWTGVGVATALVVGLLWRWTRGSKKEDYSKLKRGVVYLRLYPRSPFSPSLSPFCLKLETWLRISKVPFETTTTLQASTKGKSPWIVYNGRAIADSSIIVNFLTREFNVGLDSHLTDEQRAIGHAFKTMLEERTYFVMVYGRWIERIHDIFKYIIVVPAPVALILRPLIQRRLRSALWGQGIGRHTSAEIHAFGRTDLEAVAAFLGTKKYIMGDRITSFDATVFGMLSNLLDAPFDLPEKELIRNDFPTLQAYVERIRTEVWPDWNAICQSAKQ